jgi:hypothetical protein
MSEYFDKIRKYNYWNGETIRVGFRREFFIDREFGNLEKISDQYPKSVVSMDDFSFGNRNGITHQVAWEFV